MLHVWGLWVVRVSCAACVGVVGGEGVPYYVGVVKRLLVVTGSSMNLSTSTWLKLGDLAKYVYHGTARIHK